MSIAEKLQTIAENEQKVYDAGYAMGENNGFGDGRWAGIAEGRQKAYDEFWDLYQSNGTRTEYQNAFSGIGWTVETFKPKYDIISKSSYMLFRRSNIEGDLGEILRKLGKRLVFDIGASDLQYTFNSSLFTIIDGIEFAGTFKRNFGNGAFGSCPYLRAIKTPLPVNENTVFSTDLFYACESLEEVHFEGTIAKSISFKDCPLSLESMLSILNCLKWDPGGFPTITFSEACWSKLEGEGAHPDGFSMPWREFLEGHGWVTA